MHRVFLLIGRLSEDIAKLYAAEIISVLETIHYDNVMHRDLKPENILMTEDYHLKVVTLSLFPYHLSDRFRRCKLYSAAAS